MRRLPLFDKLPAAPIDLTVSSTRNTRCTACDLGQRAKSVCLPAEGDPSGLLVVGSAPGKEEDQAGVPHCGPTGSYLRRTLAKWWTGPVAHTNAVLCHGGEAKEAQITACRGYVARHIEAVRPKRILALGNAAVFSLLGTSPPITSVRRGFFWVSARVCDTKIPVIALVHPMLALINRFWQIEFEQDLEWALTIPDAFFADRLRFLSEGVLSIVESVEDAKCAAEALRKGKTPVSWDVETRGVMFAPSFKIVSAALGLEGSNQPVVWDRVALEKPDVRQPLLDMLADPDIEWTEQSSYDEIAAVAAWGCEMAGPRRDTRLMRKLLEPDIGASLDLMSYRVGMGGYKGEFETLLQNAIAQCRPVKKANGKGWDTRQLTMFDSCQDHEARKAIHDGFASEDKWFEPESWAYALVERDQLSIYNARDTVSTGLCSQMVWQELMARENLLMVWQELTCPASRSYVKTTCWGIPMDRAHIEALIWHASMQKEQLLPELQKFVPVERTVNFDSTEEVGSFIFEYLKVPFVKPTKGTQKLPRQEQRPSVDKEALAAVKGKHPFIDVYSAYTHWDGFIEKAQEFKRFLRADGRVHPNFALDGAESGRLSSSAPNMFNMRRPGDCPVCDGKKPAVLTCETCGGFGADPDSKRIRDCISAPDGFLLLDFDQSQIELRVMACYGKDPVLSQAFVEGKDIHEYGAEIATRQSGTKVTRQNAKPVNFGLAYDLGVGTLAKRLKCSREQAQKIMDALLGAYAGVRADKARLKSFASRVGWTYTVWSMPGRDGKWVQKMARQRPLRDLGLYGDSDEVRARRNHAQNAIFATYIQGSASGDLVTRAHWETVQWIIEEGLEHDVQVILTVYDSILLLVREGLEKMVYAKVKKIMTSRVIGYLEDGVTPFPLVVDCKIGKRLGSMRKYDG